MAIGMTEMTIKGLLKKQRAGVIPRSSHPFGVSYEQVLLYHTTALASNGKSRRVYTVTTYYFFKLQLPKYLVEYLNNGYNVSEKLNSVAAIRQRILKYVNSQFESKVYKVDFDLKNGTLLIIGESTMPYEKDALLDLRARTYLIYSEWRNDMVEREEINIRRFCGRSKKVSMQAT